MATSSQVRKWWDAWECRPERYVRAPFPGVNKTWNLSVADASAPVWAAVGQIMSSVPYYFAEAAGGTYNCRPISGSQAMSIHAYALALDLNPSKNPHKRPLTTDMPAEFITRMEGIRASGVQALTWGGRWSTPDAMHFQIDVPPEYCGQVTWDKGADMAKGPNGEPNWDKVSDWAKTAWTEAYKAGLLSDTSDPKDVVEMEQLMVTFKRADII